MKNILKTLPFLICFFFYSTLFAQLNFERDFALGPGNSGFSSWAEIDGKMYFSGNDSYFGYELWQFDPATEKAFQLTNLNRLSGSSSPKYIVAYDGAIYFTAWLGDEGSHIFKFNPQSWEVERITVSQDDSFRPSFLTVYNDKLWFSASDINGDNLWNYDSTTGAFTMIPPPADGSPTNFKPRQKFVYDNKLYLNANTSDNVLKIWHYDETTEVFNQVPTQFGDQQSLSIEDFSSCSGELMLNLSGDWYHYDQALDSCIFLVQNNSQRYRGGNCLMGKFWYPDLSKNEVKAYTPTTGAIEYLKDSISVSGLFLPHSIKAIDNDLYILENGPGQTDILHKYNPASNEIEYLFESDIIDPQMNTLMVNEDDYYFFGKNIDTEIYKYDQTNEVLDLIADINQSNGDGFTNTPPFRFQVYNDRMYFNAASQTGNPSWLGSILWSKGSSAGDYTKFKDELTSGEEAYIYDKMLEVNGRIYFSGAINRYIAQETKHFVP